MIAISDLLMQLDVSPQNDGVSTGTISRPGGGKILDSYSPADGKKIASVSSANETDCLEVIETAKMAFLTWRSLPAPKRGEIVLEIGVRIRHFKTELGTLVSYEMGKSLQEGLGEVQEMIDICVFAAGLSRQLYGLTMQSERPDHRLFEQWHPLGVVGIISAFNFPVAVWSWNAAIAWVCGNTCIWKPSEKTPVSAIAVRNIVCGVLREYHLPEGVFCLLTGDGTIGRQLAESPDIALVSATGSTRMGKQVAQATARRLGKSLLELGGNNAVIIAGSADLNLAIPAVVFGAVGTAGQRCTTTRRLFVQRALYETVQSKLLHAYNQLKIGNPLDEASHMGPLIDKDAVDNYFNAVRRAGEQGGKLLTDARLLTEFESGCYVTPVIIEAENHWQVVQEETFAPILYLMAFDTIEEAVEMQNSVPQGLSSSIFTNDLREAEYFLSNAGSDCGIANVNVGTSGAEIGGAFGGEKDTGGGRESGSDAWKTYMRRQTNTTNYGRKLPLAQGIRFDI